MSKNGNEPDETPVPGAIAAGRKAESADEPQERRRGRRGPELTTELGRAIVERVAVGGNFKIVAARLEGVGPSTLRDWLERAEREEQPYLDFAIALQQAEDEHEADCVARRNAALSDPHVLDRYMAKRFPERWSEAAARFAVFGPAGAGAGESGVTFRIEINLGEKVVGFPEPKPVEPPIEIREVKELPPPGETRN
jgi:hypothetical protein